MQGMQPLGSVVPGADLVVATPPTGILLPIDLEVGKTEEGSSQALVPLKSSAVQDGGQVESVEEVVKEDVGGQLVLYKEPRFVFAHHLSQFLRENVKLMIPKPSSQETRLVPWRGGDDDVVLIPQGVDAGTMEARHVSSISDLARVSGPGLQLAPRWRNTDYPVLMGVSKRQSQTRDEGTRNSNRGLNRAGRLTGGGARREVDRDLREQMKGYRRGRQWEY